MRPSPLRHTPAVRARWLLLATALVSLSGCVTEGPPQKPAPSASIPPQPDGLHVNRVVFTVAQVLEDRDRNGYYDTIPATVYLFDTNYAYSIRSEGDFIFRLIEPASGTVLAAWTIPWSDAAHLQALTWTGTIFPFQLDLRDARKPSTAAASAPDATPASPPPIGDRLPTTEVLIACTFQPADHAKPVECGSRLTVVIGKTR
ncbi:MAG: hypothetical protein AB7G11_14315 [Phycisphaerales bacterium]